MSVRLLPLPQRLPHPPWRPSSTVPSLSISHRSTPCLSPPVLHILHPTHPPLITLQSILPRYPIPSQGTPLAITTSLPSSSASPIHPLLYSLPHRTSLTPVVSRCQWAPATILQQAPRALQHDPLHLGLQESHQPLLLPRQDQDVDTLL